MSDITPTESSTTLSAPISAVTQPTYAAPVTPTTTPAVAVPIATSAPISATPTPTPTPTVAPAPTISSIPTTAPAAVSPSTASKPIAAKPIAAATKPKTAAEATIQANDDYMAYANSVKAGTDPITNKMMNDLFKSQNATGQRTIDAIQQQLAVSGQSGTGAGNAIIAKLARDMGISNSELASKMSDQVLSRIETYNKLGYDQAKSFEDSQTAKVKANTDYYLREGNYEAAQKEYNDNAERLGLPPIDLSSPDARTRFSQDKTQADSINAKLEADYAADGDYDKYVKAWNSAHASDTAFQNQGGDAPRGKSALIAAQQAQYRLSATNDGLSLATKLAESGDSSGAKQTLTTVMNSIGLTDSKIADSFDYSTSAEKTMITGAISAISTMAAAGATESDLKNYIALQAKMFPDSEALKLMSNANYVQILADSQGIGARKEAANKADAILTGTTSLDMTNPAVASLQEKAWTDAKKASMTGSELETQVKASGVDTSSMNDFEKQAAIATYLSDQFQTASSLKTPAALQAATVNATFETVKASFGSTPMTDKQATAVKSVISKYYTNDAEAAAPSSGADIIKSHPELQLEFTDFNGNDISTLSDAAKSEFISEKGYYDTMASQVRADNGTPMTSAEFDSIFDTLSASTTLTLDQQAAMLSSPTSTAKLQGLQALSKKGVGGDTAIAFLSGNAKPATPETVTAFASAFNSMTEEDALKYAASANPTTINLTADQLVDLQSSSQSKKGYAPAGVANGSIIMKDGIPYVAQAKQVYRVHAQGKNRDPQDGYGKYYTELTFLPLTASGISFTLDGAK